MPPVDSLFALLRAALHGERPPAGAFAATDWAALFALARREGVAAVAFEALERLPAGERPPGPVLAAWQADTVLTERRSRRRRAALGKLCAWLRGRGFRPVVLKGEASARRYPVPGHRPSGDIDLWLCGRHAEADARIRREAGVGVEEGAHHSRFLFGGATVENHATLFNTERSRSNRRWERRLRRLLDGGEGLAPLGTEGAECLAPSAEALHQLRHMAVHYAADGIALRHLLDWMLLWERDGGRIDREAYRRAVAEERTGPFADALTRILESRLGMRRGTIPGFGSEDPAAGEVLEAILAPRSPSLPGEGWRAKWRRFRSGRARRRLAAADGSAVTLALWIWNRMKRTIHL